MADAKEMKKMIKRFRHKCVESGRGEGALNGSLRDAFAEIAEEFTSTFPATVIASWRDMIAAWQRDHTNPNPYREPESGTSPRIAPFNNL